MSSCIHLLYPCPLVLVQAITARCRQKPRSRGEIGSWPRQNHARALSVHPSSANLLVDLPLNCIVSATYFCTEAWWRRASPLVPPILEGYTTRTKREPPWLVAFPVSISVSRRLNPPRNPMAILAAAAWSHLLHVCFPPSDPFEQASLSRLVTAAASR
ncbi:hypothetical protein HDV63DRAFT_268936 [Trichoderma sp. SZMC 28014]